jgi:beta-glucosidase
MGVKENGEEFMRKRFEESAVRLLLNIFRVGLFENPYLDIEKTKSTVGNPEYMKEGYDAQIRSIVMLKNNLYPPEKKNKGLYPKILRKERNWFGGPERWIDPVNCPCF